MTRLMISYIRTHFVFRSIILQTILDNVFPAILLDRVRAEITHENFIPHGFLLVIKIFDQFSGV